MKRYSYRPILLGFRKKDKQRAIEKEDVREEMLEPEVPLAEVAEPIIHRDEGQVTLDVNRSFVHYPKSAYIFSRLKLVLTRAYYRRRYIVIREGSFTRQASEGNC